MKQKYFKISEGLKAELRNATIQDNKLVFAGVLDNYQEFKKLMPALGILWNKKEKVHFLEPGSKEQIDFILNDGKLVNEKQTFQAFFTPKAIASQVVALADIKPGEKCLEPSAGVGNLVTEMEKIGAKITAYELNPEYYLTLQELNSFKYAGKFNVQNCDFLSVLPSPQFDKVIQNPPFDKSLWVKHLSHAFKFLKVGGKMVAICPNNRTNKDFVSFLVGKCYNITDLPEKAFSESGTNIRTMAVEVWKDKETTTIRMANGATLL